MYSYRCGLACVAVGNCVAFGGVDGKKTLQTVEKYDVCNKQWFAMKFMRKPRTHFASAETWLSVLYPQIFKFCFGLYSFAFTMHASSSLLLEDNNHAESVRRAWNNMRSLGLACDAVLSTEDGGMFRIHRAIMSCCSTYFRTIFTTSLVEKTIGDGPQVRTFITIPNVSASMLEVIIQYAYTGATPVTEDNVQELLPAADQFNVLGLVSACGNFLVKMLDPQNCIGIWRFAKAYFVLDLEKEALRYILDHFLEVAEKSREFLDLSSSNLNIILKDDLLNAEEEISVWNSVKRWVYYDVARRMRYVPKLLASIRLAVMPIDDFQALIKHPIISKSIQCRPYIAKVAKFILQDLDEVQKLDEKSETNVLFQPRLPHNFIFCIGGLNHWGLQFLFEVYDSRVDSWKQIEVEGPVLPRVTFHQCISLDKYIYVIGGTDVLLPINSCCRFDTELMKFEQMSPMHEMRCFLCAVEVNGKIYAIGGYDQNDGRSKTAECFVPENNQWTYIASMNFKRSDAGSCHIRNRIIVAGGYDGYEYLNSVEVYYVEFDQWCMLPDMNSCRNGLACVAVGDYIFAFGGFDGKKRLQTVEKYDVCNKQWFATKPMRKPRSNFASAVLEGKVYLMGGYQEGTNIITNDCECFDPSTHKWKKIAPLGLGRAGIAACTHGQLKNVKNYTLDSESRSILKKYLSQDLAQDLENLSQNDDANQS